MVNFSIGYGEGVAKSRASMASVSTMKVPSSLFQVSLLFSVNEVAMPQQEGGKQFFKIKITTDVTSSNPS